MNSTPRNRTPSVGGAPLPFHRQSSVSKHFLRLITSSVGKFASDFLSKMHFPLCGIFHLAHKLLLASILRPTLCHHIAERSRTMEGRRKHKKRCKASLIPLINFPTAPGPTHSHRNLSSRVLLSSEEARRWLQQAPADVLRGRKFSRRTMKFAFSESFCLNIFPLDGWKFPQTMLLERQILFPGTPHKHVTFTLCK